VAEDSQQPISQPDASSRAKASLPGEMRTLTTMIGDLEDQLDRMLTSNEALKHDLEDERKRRLGLEKAVQELEELVRVGEQEIAGKDNLEAEINHLTNERSRLAASVQELTQKLGAAEREERSQANLLRRLRLTQSHAVEEVQTVETQFERAMQMLADLRAQLKVANEERDALGGQLKVTEDQLKEIKGERDALLSEADQSRLALDEIRRSLAEACAPASEELEDGARAPLR
jgi:chromosome segregation ATPase